jgi:hypothetical protein
MYLNNFIKINDMKHIKKAMLLAITCVVRRRALSSPLHHTPLSATCKAFPTAQK